MFKEVHCNKALKPEYYEAFMLQHHKVYQEPPINYIVSIAYARAFVLENCKANNTTRKSPTNNKDWERKPIAWAMFTKEYVANVIKKNTLAQKVDRWREANGATHVVASPLLNVKLEGKHEVEEVSIVNVDLHDHILAAKKMVSTFSERVHEKKEQLQRMNVELEAAEVDVCREEGLLNGGSIFQKKLADSQCQLEAIQTVGEIANTKEIIRLYADIKDVKEVL
ncbi:hypothetical protein GOP47_0028897 [Adiantum capillus-veneris]|nr:hypothetical protein GOP47_0028897 [Adiantum capillus-veneris]